MIKDNPDMTKAWYRRGECFSQLKDWQRAKSDFSKVVELDPGNKNAKLGIDRSIAMAEHMHGEVNCIGGEVPNFFKEYCRKFGRNADSHSISLAFVTLNLQAHQTLDMTAREEIESLNDPSIAIERWGPFYSQALNSVTQIGDIMKVTERGAYNWFSKFQCMKNHKINCWVLTSGEVHVSFGCVDFAQLLFSTFEGNLRKPTSFYGIDADIIPIVRCKILHKMIETKASSRSILQVWFSSGWSNKTLDEFSKAGKALIEGQDLHEQETVLVKHWLSPKNKISLKTAIKEWSTTVRGSLAQQYTPAANFRSEIDRVDYIRYLFTGFIFEDDESSLAYGNRTMFDIPSIFRLKKASENFYHTLDLENMASTLGFGYSQSFKRSIDIFMQKRMDKIKVMVNDGLLKLDFRMAKVSVDDLSLLHMIRDLNPFTIDWSNLPDYFPKEDFLLITKVKCILKNVCSV